MIARALRIEINYPAYTVFIVGTLTAQTVYMFITF